jgi:hypothetical protein
LHGSCYFQAMALFFDIMTIKLLHWYSCIFCSCAYEKLTLLQHLPHYGVVIWIQRVLTMV